MKNAEFPTVTKKTSGRPITVNKRKLKVAPGKKYASVCFFSDLHYGTKYTALKEAEDTLKYCYDNDVNVLLVGDLIESATRYSIGAGVYDQLSPQEQLEGIIELLRPLAEKDLILGYIEGNHEYRIYKETGINIVQTICSILKIPYLGTANWNLWYAGNTSYTVYAVHGSSSARTQQGKVKIMLDVSHYFSADILAYAHMHSLIIEKIHRQTINRKSKTIENTQQFLINTGNYHKYGGYVEKNCYPPSEIGSPIVHLSCDKKEILIPPFVLPYY